jgi:hypothetical protein
MQDHLGQILDDHYAGQAAERHFTRYGITYTPDGCFDLFKDRMQMFIFDRNTEAQAISLTTHIHAFVEELLYALTSANVWLENQIRTILHNVRTDHTFILDGRIAILWENKSPKVFDAFIEELMQAMTQHNGKMDLFPESRPIIYTGYRAILSNVRVVSVGIQLFNHLHCTSSLLIMRPMFNLMSVGQLCLVDSATSLCTSHAGHPTP